MVWWLTRWWGIERITSSLWCWLAITACMCHNTTSDVHLVLQKYLSVNFSQKQSRCHTATKCQEISRTSLFFPSYIFWQIITSYKLTKSNDFGQSILQERPPTTSETGTEILRTSTAATLHSNTGEFETRDCSLGTASVVSLPGTHLSDPHVWCLVTGSPGSVRRVRSNLDPISTANSDTCRRRTAVRPRARAREKNLIDQLRDRSDSVHIFDLHIQHAISTRIITPSQHQSNWLQTGNREVMNWQRQTGHLPTKTNTVFGHTIFVSQVFLLRLDQ